MLNLIFGKEFEFDPDRVIVNPDQTFREVKQSHWFEDDFAIRVLREIDDFKVTQGRVMQDFWSANRGMDDICTGTKNLLLAKNYADKSVMLQRMGDNCYKFLLEIADTTNITVYSSIIPLFPEDLFISGRAIGFPQYQSVATSTMEAITLSFRAYGDGNCGLGD